MALCKWARPSFRLPCEFIQVFAISLNCWMTQTSEYTLQSCQKCKLKALPVAPVAPGGITTRLAPLMSTNKHINYKQTYKHIHMYYFKTYNDFNGILKNKHAMT